MVLSKALVSSGPHMYTRILSIFPQNFTFCFAYGSGVLKQSGSSTTQNNMVDFIFAVENPSQWHQQNIQWNPRHYSSLRWLGNGFVANFQQNWGAKLYFNTLVPFEESDILIKYGVISRSDLITDLLDWNDLYVAGRLHKPVEIIRQTSDSHVRSALQQNLHSAVHTALLLLPESFTELDFYRTITSLSYNGDFRMKFGEDKNKVDNIVSPHVDSFKNVYAPVMKSLNAYIEMPSAENQYCSQDVSPTAKVFHLNHLPKAPQRAIVRFWNRECRNLRQDTEDSLRAIAYDPECGTILEGCLRDIVWGSSIRQSLKGILTAGIMKSLQYSSNKIRKMFKSTTV